MGMWERIEQTQPEGENSLPAHEFTDTLIVWSEGVITRAQIITQWNLSTEDEVGLDEVKAAYDSLNANDKKGYGDVVERGFRLLALDTGGLWSIAVTKNYLSVV